MKNQCQFIHQRDIEIALRIFDDLGRFGDFNARCAMNPGFDDHSIGLGHNLQRLLVLCRHHLDDPFKGMFFVPRIDTLRGIPDLEINTALHAGSLLQDRQAIFLRRTGIDRRFIHHDSARSEISAD